MSKVVSIDKELKYKKGLSAILSTIIDSDYTQEWTASDIEHAFDILSLTFKRLLGEKTILQFTTDKEIARLNKLLESIQRVNANHSEATIATAEEIKWKTKKKS